MPDYLFLEGAVVPKKAQRFFTSLFSAAVAAGLNCGWSRTYADCKILVVYGPGGPDRYPAIVKHLAAGRPAVLFDLGYWDRKTENRKYRVSVNDLHPLPELLMAGEDPGPGRLQSSGVYLTDATPSGRRRVLLVGNAPKACAVGARGWTAQKSKEIRACLPDHQIVWRPKPSRPREPRVSHDAVAVRDIKKELAGTSLVICKHSNVAVDACFLGVPVVCEAGAAAAIYPSRLQDYEKQPSRALRQEFLNRLAYWQWGPNETADFWAWFLRTFPAYDHR